MPTRSKDVLRAYVNSQVPKNATYAWDVVASKRVWNRNSDYVKRQLAELLRMPESRARRAELDKLGAGNEFHDEIPMPYNVPPGSRERLPPIRTPERLPLITSRERLPLITSTAVGWVLELGDAAYGPASLAAAPCAFAAASGPAPAAQEDIVNAIMHIMTTALSKVIELVMTLATCSRSTAVAALEANNFGRTQEDIVNAIMHITTAALTSPKDIELVMTFARCSRSTAVAALEANNFGSTQEDIVNAIMHIMTA